MGEGRRGVAGNPSRYLKRFFLFVAATVAAAAVSAAPRAPRVDHHQHVFSPELAALFGGGFKTINARDVIALLDEAGIERAVLLSAAYSYGRPSRNVEDEYAKVRRENDWTGRQAAEFPARLIAFCGFNPLKEYALRELERCAGDANLRHGIKLHIGNSDVRLDDAAHVAQLGRVFKAANDRGMALAIHLRASISLKRPYGPDEARILLEKLLPLAPAIPVQIAHFAGSGPGYEDPAAGTVMEVLAEAVARGDPRTRNVWFDIATIVGREPPPETAALIGRRVRLASDRAASPLGAGARPDRRQHRSVHEIALGRGARSSGPRT
jgi:predicted TIM-barrel fold metal-dependent hydrolase